MPAPEPVGELDPVSLEESVIRLWSDEETFQQSIECRRCNTPLIFFEGTKTSNGRQGIHHVVA